MEVYRVESEVEPFLRVSHHPVSIMRGSYGTAAAKLDLSTATFKTLDFKSGI
jgi:hypothetical protein